MTGADTRPAASTLNKAPSMPGATAIKTRKLQDLLPSDPSVAKARDPGIGNDQGVMASECEVRARRFSRDEEGQRTTPATMPTPSAVRFVQVPPRMAVDESSS